jgi:tetratricopeptide (TPR) repeat protein
MINFVTGNYGEAIHHNDRALQAAESRQDWLQMGIHLNNGARISHRLGEYQEALGQFRKSLEFRERVGDRTGQGFTLFGIGLVYTYLEQYDEAKSALQESLAIRQAIEDERGISYTLQGLGLVALGQDKFERAIDYFERARDLHTKLNLNGERVADLSYLGQVYLKMGDLEKAAQLSGESIALLADHKNVEEVQQIYLNHYRVLSALKDPSAGEFLQQANDAMLNQAMAINDPIKRKIFLEKVRVNRAITAEIVDSDWSIKNHDSVEVAADQATS